MKSTLKLLSLSITIMLILLINILNIAYAESKGKVKLAYVNWSSEVVSTHVIKVVLEELGYEVTIVPVNTITMWQMVAKGEADGMVAAWLDNTQARYYELMKDNVENIGHNLEGTKTGLVVPSYVTINSIEELNANAEKFGGKVVGIDAGAGMMGATVQVINKYGLDKFWLTAGSDAAMVTALGNAIKEKKWIVVTGWTPHWMFSRWELKYLNDPKQIYDTNGYISTIVRKGLKQDMPEVYRVLGNFHWLPADMEKVMVWNEEKDADPYQNAKKWVHENADKVKKWITP